MWDNAPVTIDFNGFVETIQYGQFLHSGFSGFGTGGHVFAAIISQWDFTPRRTRTTIRTPTSSRSRWPPELPSVRSISPARQRPFSFSPSGFGALSANVRGSGRRYIVVQRAGPSQTSAYGDGSTGATIAQDLALKASSSLVTVTAEGSSLFLQAKQTGGSFTFPYNLSFSTSASFSSFSREWKRSIRAPTSGPAQVYSYFSDVQHQWHGQRSCRLRHGHVGLRV